MNAFAKGESEDDALIQTASELTIQYASQSKVEEAPRDHELLSHFATVAVGQLSNDALLLEREGMNDKAVKMMGEILDEFGRYLPAPTLSRYNDLTRRMEHGLNEFDRNQPAGIITCLRSIAIPINPARAGFTRMSEPVGEQDLNHPEN
jgi:hypothetical protein